jgi:hypothetical protein
MYLEKESIRNMLKILRFWCFVPFQRKNNCKKQAGVSLRDDSNSKGGKPWN